MRLLGRSGCASGLGGLLGTLVDGGGDQGFAELDGG